MGSIIAECPGASLPPMYANGLLDKGVKQRLLEGSLLPPDSSIAIMGLATAEAYDWVSENKVVLKPEIQAKIDEAIALAEVQGRIYVSKYKDIFVVDGAPYIWRSADGRHIVIAACRPSTGKIFIPSRLPAKLEREIIALERDNLTHPVYECIDQIMDLVQRYFAQQKAIENFRNETLFQSSPGLLVPVLTYLGSMPSQAAVDTILKFKSMAQADYQNGIRLPQLLSASDETRMMMIFDQFYLQNSTGRPQDPELIGDIFVNAIMLIKDNRGSANDLWLRQKFYELFERDFAVYAAIFAQAKDASGISAEASKKNISPQDMFELSMIIAILFCFYGGTLTRTKARHIFAEKSKLLKHKNFCIIEY
jgi:hypothetical protein